MQGFDIPWGLFFGGIFVGVFVETLIIWVRSKKYSVKWYEWVIGVCGFLLFLFTIQNFFAAFAEFESGPALTYLWALGIPSLIIMWVSVMLVWGRNHVVS